MKPLVRRGAAPASPRPSAGFLCRFLGLPRRGGLCSQAPCVSKALRPLKDLRIEAGGRRAPGVACPHGHVGDQVHGVRGENRNDPLGNVLVASHLLRRPARWTRNVSPCTAMQTCPSPCTLPMPVPGLTTCQGGSLPLLRSKRAQAAAAAETGRRSGPPRMTSSLNSLHGPGLGLEGAAKELGLGLEHGSAGSPEPSRLLGRPRCGRAAPIPGLEGAIRAWAQ